MFIPYCEKIREDILSIPIILKVNKIIDKLYAKRTLLSLTISIIVAFLCEGNARAQYNEETCNTHN